MIPKIMSDNRIIEIMGEAFWLAAGKRVAGAQRKKTLEQIMEWGEGPCPHVDHPRGKHWCGECWQALKAQLEALC